MKLNRIKIGDEITQNFLNRLVDKANENELKPIAPLFKKSTTNGTQLGINLPVSFSNLPQWGRIVPNYDGWTNSSGVNNGWVPQNANVDPPDEWVWVLPCDSIGNFPSNIVEPAAWGSTWNPAQQAI